MTGNDLVPELTNGELEMIMKEKLAFLDFFAEWCMPCTIMSPIIDELSMSFGKKIKFGKVNVDENHKIAEKFEVSSIPTFVLIKDSHVVERLSGSVSQDELEEVIRRHL